MSYMKNAYFDEIEAAEEAAYQEASAYQVGGTHYQKAVQPWEAMEAWMTQEEFAGYLRGNVIKYVARCWDKNGVEDLEKAQHYLAKLIEVADKQK